VSTQFPSVSLETSAKVATFVAGEKVGRKGFDGLAPFYEEAIKNLFYKTGQLIEIVSMEPGNT
jgi:hypothetical protein